MDYIIAKSHWGRVGEFFVLVCSHYTLHVQLYVPRYCMYSVHVHVCVLTSTQFYILSNKNGKEKGKERGGAFRYHDCDQSVTVVAFTCMCTHCGIDKKVSIVTQLA